MWSRAQKDRWHLAEVLSGNWPAGAANKPGRPVRMDVVMRWIRMKYPDGISFDEDGNNLIGLKGFGWLPKSEKVKQKDREKPERKPRNNVLIFEKNQYRKRVG